METNHSLYIGDSFTQLKNIPKNTAQLVVTSPPYWNIKDYSMDKQIGYNQSYQDYLDSLYLVWNECKRILSPGCKIVVNVGDQFIRAKDNNGIYEIIPIHADIIKQFKELGLTFLGNIIWQKISNTKTTGGCSWMGSIYYPRDGYVTYEHEYIMIFKKSGKAPRPSCPELKEKSKLPKEFRSKWFRGIWSDLSPVKQNSHIAMFPLELPERIIRMFTFAGDTVLDPFVGSGTTMQASETHDRNSIGIELNPDFIDLIKNKVNNLSVMEDWR